MVARKRVKVKKKAASKKAHRKKTASRSSARPAKKTAKKAAKKLASKKAVKQPIKKAAKKKPAVSRKKTASKPIAKKKTPSRSNSGISSRSAAALKGWKTRRAKERLQKKRDRETRARQLHAHPELKGIEKAYQKSIEQIEKEAYERGVEAGRKQVELSDEDKRKLFIDQFKDWVESDESVILARLKLAAEYGELDTEVWEVADEYDWDPHEVYDLYYSPEGE